MISLTSWLNLLSSFSGKAVDVTSAVVVAKKYKAACMRLWEGFTGHKPMPRNYLDRDDFRMAYLLGFHLINSARLGVLLERLFGERRISLPAQPVSLWDFGCGTGAMASTLAEHLKKKQIKLADLHLCDASQELLRQVESSLRAALPAGMLLGKVHRHGGRFSPVEVKFSAQSSRYTHIFCFGYLLNELDEKARVAMGKWMAGLARSSVPALVLIVDSSDELVCRGLMDFRDEAVAKGMHAIYPCPHDLGCPLAGSKDWCYSEAVWRLPAVQQKIDKIIEHPRRTMTVSNYAFANQSFMALQNNPAHPQRILVGKPRDKFRKDLQIPVYCQENGEAYKDLRGAQEKLGYMRGMAVPLRGPRKKG